MIVRFILVVSPTAISDFIGFIVILCTGLISSAVGSSQSAYHVSTSVISPSPNKELPLSSVLLIPCPLGLV